MATLTTISTLMVFHIYIQAFEINSKDKQNRCYYHNKI